MAGMSAATAGARSEQSRPRAWSLETNDPDVLLESVRGAAIQLEPTTRGRGSIELSGVDGAQLSITSGRLAMPILSFGGIDPNHAVYALQLGDGRGTWNSSPFDERTLWSYGPGSEHEGVGVATPWWAAITLPRELASALEPAGAPLRRGELRLRTADATAGLADVIRLAITVIATGAPDRSVLINIESEVRDRLADVLATGAIDRPTQTAADKVVAACIEAGSTLGPVPSVAALAGAVGVSDRWVRAAFNKRFGMPPSAWFRLRALNGARRELASADPSHTTVTEVATRWGFWHLGRFAQSYSGHFAELPSETLNRASSRRPGGR